MLESTNQIIEVSMTRSDVYDREDTSECHGIIAFMRILTSCIHRCTSSVANTVYEESLVHIPNSLMRPKSDLYTIYLFRGTTYATKFDYTISL
jgi:hypothetical protein